MSNGSGLNLSCRKMSGERVDDRRVSSGIVHVLHEDYALADVKGRPIAILLTGGEAHECTVAERLVRRVKPSKRMLGDKAYGATKNRPRDYHP